MGTKRALTNPDELVGRVYLLWAVGTDRFKIGFTAKKSANSRAYGLESMCPYPIGIVADIPGTTTLERSIHREFKEYRVHRGEWFALTEDATWQVLKRFGINDSLPPCYVGAAHASHS
jgi:hypothetical protein